MGKGGRKGGLPAGVVDDRAPLDRRPSGIQQRAPEPDRTEARSRKALALVDQLVCADRDQVAPIVRQLLPLGSAALEELTHRFPGPIWNHPDDSAQHLQSPEDLSAIAGALTTFDAEAVPYVTRLLKSAHSDTRRYALVVAASMQRPKVVSAVAAAAMDEDRGCRKIAVLALRRFSETRHYDEALGSLRRTAADAQEEPARRRYAVSALTQLRNVSSLRLLVDLLNHENMALATSGRVGLRILTAHDFGFRRSTWLRWLAEHGALHRVQWLMRALGDARPQLRTLAIEELWRETRLVRPPQSAASEATCATIRKEYEQWWGLQLLLHGGGA